MTERKLSTKKATYDELKRKLLNTQIKLKKYQRLYQNSEERYTKFANLHKKCISEEKYISVLSKMFTPGQIKLIMNPSSVKIKWCEEDFSAAMSARSYGTAAYEYWRCTRGIPMPAPSTLRKRAALINFEPGVLSSVLKHMELKRENMVLRETLCVASFDEIYTSPQIDIEKKREQVVNILKSHSYDTVVSSYIFFFRLVLTKPPRCQSCGDYLAAGSKLYIIITTQQ